MNYNLFQKLLPCCPYHFVLTILSSAILSEYHFVRIPFCPLPFCPLPLFLSGHLSQRLRSVAHGNLVVPRRVSMGPRSVAVSGPTLWNSRLSIRGGYRAYK